MFIEVTSLGDGTPLKISLTLNRPDRDLRLDQIPTHKEQPGFGGKWTTTVSYSPVICGAIREKVGQIVHNGGRVLFQSGYDQNAIIEGCLQLPEGSVSWNGDRNRAFILAPRLPLIQDMMRNLQASELARNADDHPLLGKWSIPVTTVRDFIKMNEQLPEYDRIPITDEIRNMESEALPAPYDGTAESLRGMPLDILRTVQANNQSYQMIKTRRDTLKNKLEAMGIKDLYDLLMYRPKRYIDRSNPQDVRDLIEGETATIVGKIVEWTSPSRNLNVMHVEDSRGVRISCSFFNQSWRVQKHHVGDDVILVGKYTPWHSDWSGKIVPQLSNPIVDPLEAAGALPIMPEYKTPGKVGLSSTALMHCEQELINRLGDGFKGPVWTDRALKDNGVTSVSYGEALKTMHLPKSREAMDESQSALAFCEIVELLVWIESHRKGDGGTLGVDNTGMDGSLVKAYESAFRWPLTGAQSRAVESIRKGLADEHGLRALLVGDVGSGKTTVMHMAALSSVEAGHQAVICAPTEILAQQLFEEFMKVYDQFPEDLKSRVSPVLHCGYKGKGSTARRRADDAGIKDGTINLIFGTHSVLNVEYHDLGFVGVDEQHKFGAKQRSRLLEVRGDGREPDMLMQTATPIPRSMAQVYYGDVDYLRLDEMPAGRQPIVTEWVKKKGMDVVGDPSLPLWNDVRGEIRKGHGVFVVCPMVAESEKTDAASVKETAARLESTVFRDARVRVVYGGQSQKAQDEAILGFKNGEVDVLVASSVVEVGVSCEKATRMVVLDANRFGLASLHQIRGRIGRSSLPSKCWLVAMTFNEVATSRMQAMCDTLDGWTLSKTDLRNRGTGSIFSERQSGEGDLVFADLVSDAKWIEPARNVALKLIQGPDARERVDEARRYFGLEDDAVSLA